MIKKIETIQHLRLEIVRRKTLSDTIEKKIKEDRNELKESLNPQNLLKNAFGNKAITTTLISGAAIFAIFFIAKKTVFKKGGGIFQQALSFILPKVASKVASEASETIFSKIKTAFYQTAPRPKKEAPYANPETEP
jgi:hypothetical protein